MEEAKTRLYYTAFNPGLNHIVACHITADSWSFSCVLLMFIDEKYNIILPNT